MIQFAALAVLVIIAHPDDETLYSGFLHALTHKIGARVDLVCITNGEGGFRHSHASASIYGNLDLSNEKIARENLPRIRQKELLASGQILGIRKYFFYDQLDLKYSTEINDVLENQWNQVLVRQMLIETLKTGNGASGYDLMLVMLPNNQSHGHHTVSGLLALSTINELKLNRSTSIKIPTVLGGSEFVLNQAYNYSSNYFGEISFVEEKEFRFNRRWKLRKNSVAIDYQLIVLWSCSEHKSQGSLIPQTLTRLARENEQYFYFSLNKDVERFQFIENLFEQLIDIHR